MELAPHGWRSDVGPFDQGEGLSLRLGIRGGFGFTGADGAIDCRIARAPGVLEAAGYIALGVIWQAIERVPCSFPSWARSSNLPDLWSVAPILIDAGASAVPARIAGILACYSLCMLRQSAVLIEPRVSWIVFPGRSIFQEHSHDHSNVNGHSRTRPRVTIALLRRFRRLRHRCRAVAA